MWDISWPKSMDSGWGRKPYWSAGMALATATERPLRAAKCLAYSPAALDASGAATAEKEKGKSEQRESKRNGTAWCGLLEECCCWPYSNVGRFLRHTGTRSVRRLPHK